MRLDRFISVAAIVAIVVVLAALVGGIRSCIPEPPVTPDDVTHQAVIARLQERALAAEKRAAGAEARADSLRALWAQRDTSAARIVTRWRERPADLPPAETEALADSAIAACTWALSACRETVDAYAATVAAKDSVIVSVKAENDALVQYNRNLRERLSNASGGSLWTTAGLVGGGAVLGGALGGLDGAVDGALVGLTLDVARVYVGELLRGAR